MLLQQDPNLEHDPVSPIDLEVNIHDNVNVIVISIDIPIIFYTVFQTLWPLSDEVLNQIEEVLPEQEEGSLQQSIVNVDPSYPQTWRYHSASILRNALALRRSIHQEFERLEDAGLGPWLFPIDIILFNEFMVTLQSCSGRRVMDTLESVMNFYENEELENVLWEWDYAPFTHDAPPDFGVSRLILYLRLNFEAATTSITVAQFRQQFFRLRRAIQVMTSEEGIANPSDILAFIALPVKIETSVKFCPGAPFTCPIHKMVQRDGARVATVYGELNCRHYFCESCANEWFKTSNSCSMCRDDIYCWAVEIIEYSEAIQAEIEEIMAKDPESVDDR